jgi:hypothetical protein
MFDLFNLSHLDFTGHANIGHDLLQTGDHLIGLAGSQGGGSPGQASPNGSGGVSPAFTLVGNPTGLQIDLIWDATVTSATNWASIEDAVVAAAKIFTNHFSNHIVINIAVGLDEVGGLALPANAASASEPGFVLDSYGDVQAGLTAADAGLVAAGLMAPNAVADAVAAQEGAATFPFMLVPNAEAKALDLPSAVPGVIDGFIGLSSSLLAFTGSAGGAKSGLIDAVAAAAHEISEVMGRIETVGNIPGLPGINLYTPLDLFRYSAPGALDVTPGPGYFSLDEGATSLNTFNDPTTNTADAGDWSLTFANRGNAFDAFVLPGTPLQVTSTDILEMAALGYTFVPNG